MLIFPTYQTLLTKAAAATSSIVTTNLVSHWDLGNSSSYSGSGTTITDLTGNGNNGSIENSSNFSYNSGVGGHGVSDITATSNPGWIRRTTDYIDDVGTGDFTIEFWVNIYRSVDNALFWRNLPNATSPFNENFALYIHEGKMRASNWFAATAATTVGSWTHLDSSAVYPDGSYKGWEHLVFSRIGTGDNNTKFYRNNSLIHTWTNKAQYDDANSSTDSGITSFGGSNIYTVVKGKIAIYRFYSGTGLTSSQVTTNYDASKSRFGL